MVTTGPGSKATTARLAVSYSRITMGSLGQLDAGHAKGCPCLVADVELEEHGREGLDRGGVGQRAGVQRPQAGDEAHQLARRAHRLSVVRADEHVALDGLVDVPELLG